MNARALIKYKKHISLVIYYDTKYPHQQRKSKVMEYLFDSKYSKYIRSLFGFIGISTNDVNSLLSLNNKLWWVFKKIKEI